MIRRFVGSGVRSLPSMVLTFRVSGNALVAEKQKPSNPFEAYRGYLDFPVRFGLEISFWTFQARFSLTCFGLIWYNSGHKEMVAVLCSTVGRIRLHALSRFGESRWRHLSSAADVAVSASRH